MVISIMPKNVFAAEEPYATISNVTVSGQVCIDMNGSYAYDVVVTFHNISGEHEEVKSEPIIMTLPRKWFSGLNA